MADNKKYYYIRLKENFFESEEIVLLESMQDGYLYSNILIKLYLKSLKNNGKLIFNECIPYNQEMIATITRHSVGVVEKALNIFEELGLIDVLNNRIIYMSDIECLVGKSSTEADRKRISRAKNKNIGVELVEEKEEESGQMSGQMSDKSIPEFRDKSLEIRDYKYTSQDIDIFVKELNTILKKYYNGSVAKRFNTSQVTKRLKVALKNDSFDIIQKGYENYLKQMKADNKIIDYVKGCHSFIIDRMYNDYIEDFDYSLTPVVNSNYSNKQVIGDTTDWYQESKSVSEEEEKRLKSILDKL